MNLKKHRESVFKSFRGNKKEINRTEQNRKIREWFNSPEQVEGRRQMKKVNPCGHGNMAQTILANMMWKVGKSIKLE